MFVADLGEFAYGNGDAVVLSKDDAPVAPEGEAAALPTSCAPEAYFIVHVQHQDIIITWK